MICKYGRGPTFLLTSAGHRAVEKRWSLPEATQRVRGRAVTGAGAPQTQIRPLCHKQGQQSKYTRRWDLTSAQSREIITSLHLLASPVSLWVAGLPLGISTAPQNTSLSRTLLTQLRFCSPTVTRAGLLDPRFPGGFPCSGEGRFSNPACLHLQHLPAPLPHPRLRSLPLNLAVPLPRVSPTGRSNSAGQKLLPCAVALQLPEHLRPKTVGFPGDFFFLFFFWMMMMQKRLVWQGAELQVSG